MNYKKYIDLGFERSELHDEVEFEKTGYYGYYNSGTYYIVPISADVVVDLFTEFGEDNDTNTAC